MPTSAFAYLAAWMLIATVGLVVTVTELAERQGRDPLEGPGRRAGDRRLRRTPRREWPGWPARSAGP